jgi:hypothetical protein
LYINAGSVTANGHFVELQSMHGLVVQQVGLAVLPPLDVLHNKAVSGRATHEQAVQLFEQRVTTCCTTACTTCRLVSSINGTTACCTDAVNGQVWLYAARRVLPFGKLSLWSNSLLCAMLAPVLKNMRCIHAVFDETSRC